MFPSIQIPDAIIRNWEINDWLSLKTTHIVFRATHKQTKVIKIFQLISKSSYSKAVWESLSSLDNRYLLLPEQRKNIGNGYLLRYAPATPLDNIIQADGMSVKMILQLLLDISQALQKLHQADILHMDISPKNIYLSEQGKFILGDFSESIQLKSTRIQTRHQSTPGYDAPESVRGKPVKASDQYGLAMLAYVLFNDGFLPKDSHSPPEPSIIESDPKIGQEIFSVTKKAISPEANLRYENIVIFHQTIQALLDDLSDTTNYYLHIPDKTHSFFQLSTEIIPDASLTKRKRNPLMIPAFLLLLIFLFFWINHSSENHLWKKPRQQRNISKEEVPLRTDNLLKTDPQPSATNSANIKIIFFEELDFADKNLSSLLEVIAECENPTRIHSIYGENNHLTTIEELELFSSLQNLYLSNNQIQNTDSFQKLNNLSVLILSDNLCTNLQGLSTLEQLNFLDLSGNKDLSDITPLSECHNLNTLVLSDTAVTESSIQELQAKLPECKIIS